MSLIRAGCAQDAFKFQAGNNIGEMIILIGIISSRVVWFRTSGNNDRSHIDIQQLICHIMIYGLGLTGLHTLKTLTTCPAVKTATCFSLCGLLIHCKVSLLKGFYPFGSIQGRDLGPGHLRFTGINRFVVLFLKILAIK